MLLVLFLKSARLWFDFETKHKFSTQTLFFRSDPGYPRTMWWSYRMARAVLMINLSSFGSIAWKLTKLCLFWVLVPVNLIYVPYVFQCWIQVFASASWMVGKVCFLHYYWGEDRQDETFSCIWFHQRIPNALHWAFHKTGDRGVYYLGKEVIGGSISTSKARRSPEV